MDITDSHIRTCSIIVWPTWLQLKWIRCLRSAKPYRPNLIIHNQYSIVVFCTLRITISKWRWHSFYFLLACQFSSNSRFDLLNSLRIINNIVISIENLSVFLINLFLYELLDYPIDSNNSWTNVCQLSTIIIILLDNLKGFIILYIFLYIHFFMFNWYLQWGSWRIFNLFDFLFFIFNITNLVSFSLGGHLRIIILGSFWRYTILWIIMIRRISIAFPHWTWRSLERFQIFLL